MFHIKKIKKLLSLIKKKLFLSFLTNISEALVNTTHKITILYLPINENGKLIFKEKVSE